MKRIVYGKATRLSLLALTLLLAVFWLAPGSLAETQPTEKKATVSGQVVDGQGAPLVSQLVFTAENAVQRINTDLFGRFKTQLALGEYTVEVSKGSLYERKEISLSVPDRNPLYLNDITLAKLYDTPWLAGDLHQHTVYSFDGANSPFEVYVSDLAAGLDYGVVTDHNDVRADSEFVNGNHDGFIGLPGIEITTNRGHFNAINFARVVDPDTTDGTAAVQRIVSDVRSDSQALLQINHPDRTDGSFSFEDWPLAEQFDLMEVWNGKRLPPYVIGEPNQQTLERWLRMIRNGLYLPAAGGSDNHDISGNLLFAQTAYSSEDDRYFNQSMFSGTPRTYVLPVERTAQGILDALKQGRSFVTNNPLAFLTVQGASPGDTVAPGEVIAKVLIQSNRDLTAYRLRVNGTDTPWEPISGNVYEIGIPFTLFGGDFVMLEVRGERGDYAFTNPVFAAK